MINYLVTSTICHCNGARDPLMEEVPPSQITKRNHWFLDMAIK